MKTSTKNAILANVQLYTTDHFKILIDNLTRKMFELQIDGGENLTADLIESHAKNIKSEIKISNLDKINVKLDEFHWAVFDACISIIKDGYEYTTLAILRRKLGGSANKWSATTKDENGNDKKVSVDLKLDDDIKNALEELAMVRIAVNMEDTKKFYESPTQSGTYKFNGYILANESLEMKVNGQEATLYHFTSKSILFATSEMKDQIITADQELFHPPIRMTRRSIAITHFLLRRIYEMKGSLEASKTNKRVTPLRHTILFDTLYKACGMENDNKMQKYNAREITEKILKYYEGKGFIKGYTFETGKAGKTRAINIDV